MEKSAVFPADMSVFGKYCTGEYGQIGVYRIKTRA